MGVAAFRIEGGQRGGEPGLRVEKASPVDLVHLARQTMGDRALEKELLALFERQAGQIAERLRLAEAGPEAADLAHKLKGSARAVGAAAVAAAAEHYEHGARAGVLGPTEAERLGVAVAEARDFISALMA